MNSYFQLVHKDEGTFLRLIPATGDGEALDVREIMEYLDTRVIEYDVKNIQTALANLGTETAEILLTTSPVALQRENYILKIDPQKMWAVMRFHAPSEGGMVMRADSVIADLRARNFRFGIKSDRIMQHFQDQSYCTDIVVAEGKGYRPGKDATIEYFFDTDRKAKPTVLEDGSVDFHSLNTICPVKEGDLLARLIPADPGETGMNIYGETLKPHPVRNTRLRFGRNIRLSDDKREIYSEVSGHVTLEIDRVFVSNVLTLENVDVSTGNIEYEGSIQVNGNVMSGYSIKATGDVAISGVVEGASVEAGGNVSIARGMNGRGKGVIRAEGNVIAKFLENAEVYAGGFISTESIMQSKAQAGKDIEVTGKKGFIAGGSVMASNAIRVRTLGSSLGATTQVEVGVNPALKREQIQLEKDMADIEKNLRRIEPILAALIQKKSKGIDLPVEQELNMRELMEVRTKTKDEQQRIAARLEELSEIIESGKNPTVYVTGEVYPGTRITILDVSLTVKNTMKYCKFIRSQGDVKMTSL